MKDYDDSLNLVELGKKLSQLEAELRAYQKQVPFRRVCIRCMTATAINEIEKRWYCSKCSSVIKKRIKRAESKALSSNKITKKSVPTTPKVPNSIKSTPVTNVLNSVKSTSPTPKMINSVTSNHKCFACNSEKYKITDLGLCPPCKAVYMQFIVNKKIVKEKSNRFLLVEKWAKNTIDK